MKLGTLAGSDFELTEVEAKLEITGLTADSREVRPGFLFAALPGTQVDGTRFIASALEKGAVAILLPEGVRISLPAILDQQTIVYLYVDNPRQALAHLAARFYQKQPETIVAVTGTNGKTSVASFVRQIWQFAGEKAASLGTIGLVTSDENVTSTHTTPEPVTLHKMLAGLVEKDIQKLAIEASSHGLQQNRLDGVRIKAAGFTNISRDHLDYHPTFEDYFAQKQRLFSELLPVEGTAVVDVDSPGGQTVADLVRRTGKKLMTVGQAGEALQLVSIMQDGYAEQLTIVYQGQTYTVHLPLVGRFQASNALVAAGLCLAVGMEPEHVFQALSHLKGAKGRLEYVGAAKTGAPVFIDYAHTPDALENALLALRPYVKNRLIVVFGCGGDRDKGKRPQMGRIAVEMADSVYVTDDNPRSEVPAQIRSEIMAAAPGAVEIADRFEAIRAALVGSEGGDVILIAGKGHETGQIVGDQILPYSDHEAVEMVLKAK